MIEFAYPYLLFAIPLLAAFLFWAQAKSFHPMSAARKRALFVVRTALMILIVLALCRPAIRQPAEGEAVVFVLDHSASLGGSGKEAAYRQANELASLLPASAKVGFVATAETASILRGVGDSREPVTSPTEKKEETQTNLAAGIDLARGLLPSGSARRIVLLTDGIETRGSMERAARDAAAAGARIDIVPVKGESRPDVRITSLRPSRSRLHEGAALDLSADVESSISGPGVVRLFENGIEVASEKIEIKAGEPSTVTFRRTPDEKSLYTFRARVEGFPQDELIANNESTALVDVRGKPLLLYVEGEADEARYLTDAMNAEGIRLQTRPAQAIPETVQELSSYDAVILSDTPARDLSDLSMAALHDYVEKLGGGLIMVGGMNSFGVGGYYRTPIEEMLPVKIKAPEQEEKNTVALAVVMDRSGSMEGVKIEQAKSAAIATAELLGKRDYLCLVAFDSEPHTIIPIEAVGEIPSLNSRIAGISSGGGTNIYPGMVAAHSALNSVKAKVKHMIVLTDGQTEGSGYPALAALMKTEGITTSTVGIGDGADMALLQQIAAAGGGQCYSDQDPTSITRIFAQDAMRHLGRLIREEPFKPVQTEDNPMIKGWGESASPELLGYVKTTRKANAQVPLVTDLNDPLLATWRFGLGKVTAFTSDCKSRWAALWIAGWPGYSQFWGQILRESARDAQSGSMDLRTEYDGEKVKLTVDLMEDAAEFKNDAEVSATIFHLPENAFESSMREVDTVKLKQAGPGRYSAEYAPEQAGAYFIRARSGAQLVSAGIVHDVSSEAAVGQVNRSALEKVSAVTGGSILEKSATLPALKRSFVRTRDLTPALLVLALLLFVADLLIRRWENFLGLSEKIFGRLKDEG